MPILFHISKGDAEAKYNVEINEFVYNYGFKNNELKMIESIIEENRTIIISRWTEYINNRVNDKI